MTKGSIHIEILRNSRIACALAAALCGGCSATHLDDLQRFYQTVVPQTGVQVNFCTDPSQEVKSKLKYIIVLDHSGSNVKNFKMDPNTGLPDLTSGGIDFSAAYATDPVKSARYGDPLVEGSLLNFLASTPPNDPADPTTYFALLHFSSGVASYPASLSGFTSDVADFYNYATWAKTNIADDGPTNYLDTLRGVQNIIQTDINQAKTCAAMSVGSPATALCPKPGVAVSSTYVIVFMSDGAPVMGINGVGAKADGSLVQTGAISLDKQSSRDVLGTVAGIVGLQSNTRYVDAINLFTIYYYFPMNPDFTAQKLLQDMATVGNGIAYNIASGSNIDYRRFKPPGKLIKFSLSDVFVTNISAGWDSNGKPIVDTDMDGIPDENEAILGSDPAKADSDGNGVSDLVELQLNGQPCGQKNASGKCVKGAGTIKYASSTSCSGIPKTVTAGVTTFASSDPSGLNDCEKNLLNDAGGISNPDSNNDLIPDWLEFRNGIPFQLGTSSAKDVLDSDGTSIYQKIKTSLPTRMPLYRVLDPHPAKYDLNLISTSASQDCYRLNVSDLPTAGPNNTVQVDVVLRSPLTQDRYLYRRGRKAFAGSSLTLQFNDWTDPAEIAAGTWRIWP